MNATQSDSKDFAIHRGEVVRLVVDKMDCNIKQLSKKLGITRGTLYRQFERADMDWRYIVKIGRILHYDFSSELPEIKLRDFDSLASEPVGDYSTAEDTLLNRAIKEIDKWKTESYINLQEVNKWREKYYELLEQVLRNQQGGSKGQ